SAALLLFVTVKLRVWPDSFAGPAEILVAQNMVCNGASSLTVRSVPFVNEGASLTEFTVMMKDRDDVSTPPFAVPPLSVNVTVMVVVPETLAAGLIVTLPLEPVVVAFKWAASLGTTVELLEVAVTEIMVLASPVSNATTNCVSSLVVASGRFASGVWSSKAPI